MRESEATYFQTFLLALEGYPDKRGILGDEWIIFPPDPNYGYECTPRNALTFGAMGVDGVHYAILTIDCAVRDDSPVIQIGPMDFSEPYSVLGETFLDYLAQGCGVTLDEMKSVFDAERSGAQTLISFLRQRFKQPRLFDETRRQKLDRYLDLIELKP